MAVHDLKCWPGPFQAIKRGEKPWELRDNDRDYQPGDRLLLQEFDPRDGLYTGDMLIRDVPFILYGDGTWLPAGKCIMTLAEVPQ